MPVKKRVAKSREYRITEEALRAFVAGDEVELHRRLGLKPWEPSPLLVEVEGECPSYYGNGPYAQAWPRVREIRRELQRAAQR